MNNGSDRLPRWVWWPRYAICFPILAIRWVVSQASWLGREAVSIPAVCGLLGHKPPKMNSKVSPFEPGAEWYNGAGWARRCRRCGTDM